MPAPRFVLDEFWPSDLFLGGVPGAWYDPTDLSTMFQDSAGTTPVTAVEQPVGLILDKSQGLSFSNGTRAINLLPAYSQDVSQSDWSKTQVVTPNATTITDTAVNNFHFLQSQTISVTAGVSHTLRLRLQAGTLGFGGAHFFDGTARGCSINLTTGALGTPYGGASASAVADGAGWILTITCTPTANGVVAIYCSNTNALVSYLGSGQSITATNIDFRRTADVGVTPSPYQLITSGWAATNPGNHASQSTAASRPTYRARYNLLTFSEEFQNAAYSKQASVTITADSSVAPDGTTTADTFASSSAVGNYGFFQLVTGSSGVSYTASVYAKAGTATSFVFGMTTQGETAICYYTFNVSAGTAVVANVGGFTSNSATITPVGNGWYRCVVTGTTPAGTTSIGIFPRLPAVANILIWGAQLLTAADVTATGNAYQRIAAATVYDTAPVFRPYLAFDGMDDSLSTTAINFTATDKMSVFSGVTKNTDGSAGCVAELSATAITNDGSFALFSSAGGAVWYVAGRGTALGSFACATFTAPITNTVSSMIDIAQPALASELIPRINTTINQTGASGTDIGTGNFGNWPLFIGRRNNASLPFNGRLYSLIVRGAASSVTEIADTELWVNARTGAF